MRIRKILGGALLDKTIPKTPEPGEGTQNILGWYAYILHRSGSRTLSIDCEQLRGARLCKTVHMYKCEFPLPLRPAPLSTHGNDKRATATFPRQLTGPMARTDPMASASKIVPTNWPRPRPRPRPRPTKETKPKAPARTFVPTPRAGNKRGTQANPACLGARQRNHRQRMGVLQPFTLLLAAQGSKDAAHLCVRVCIMHRCPYSNTGVNAQSFFRFEKDCGRSARTPP